MNADSAFEAVEIDMLAVAHYDNFTVCQCLFDKEPERVKNADSVSLLTLSWPGFELEIPWPEGITAQEAIEAWKRT